MEEQNKPRRSSAKRGLAPKIRKLRERYPEMSNSAIARKVGCNPSNVTTVLKTFLKGTSEEQLREYQTNKADVFDAVGHRILASINAKKINKSNMLQAVTAVAILHDKSQVLRGQATGINVNVLLDVVDAIRSRAQSLPPTSEQPKSS